MDCKVKQEPASVSSKYSVVGTLHHRAQIICSSPQLLQQEEKHLQKALTRCKYPVWVLHRVKVRTKAINNKNGRGTNNSGNNSNQKPYMVTPYYKGLGESLKKICSKHGVQVYFKGGNTIKNLLVAPKDQDSIQIRVESYIDINVTGWNVMRNILESPQEHLERGSKNIKSTLPNI